MTRSENYLNRYSTHVQSNTREEESERMLYKNKNEMDCVGIEISNTVHFFVSVSSLVEFATSEHLGRLDVTPSDGVTTYPSVSR